MCIRDSLWPAHADILTDGQIEQKIILGYITNQIHYLLWSCLLYTSENQQKQIQDTEEFIERFRYKATKAVQVQSLSLIHI